MLVLLVLACLPGRAQLSAPPCAPAPAGMVGWWPGEGNANDFAGTNNGVLAGAATANTPAKVGNGFQLDGLSGCVQVPDSPVLKPATLTVEGWVRFDSLDTPGLGGSPAGVQYIVFKQNSRTAFFEGFTLNKVRAGGSDYLLFGVTSAAGQVAEVPSVTTVQTGAWYHVAGVRGTNSIQIFVNGQLENQVGVSFPQDYGTFPMCFGSTGQSYYDHKLKGMLDEVSLYNRPLSAPEIAAVYVAGAAGKCVNVPLAITQQPQSQMAAAGDAMAFGVSAVGRPVPGFQWQKDGVYLSPGGDFSGVTNSILSLVSARTNDSGNYQVIVTNSSGAVTSTVATLTVIPLATAVSGPQDALVLVNSQSASYLDFKRRIQPYLDNFGVPYGVVDLATNSAAIAWSNHALIIIGHNQIDTNQLYLSAAAQSNLTAAVLGGVGLVNFDSALWGADLTPRYAFVRDIFGFGAGSNVVAGSVTFPPTEPGAQMHYVTARHDPNENLTLKTNLNLSGLVAPATTTAVALAGGAPLVTVCKHGAGRAVQWSSYDWMAVAVLGPLSGLDDLLWRGMVWAARKPFVMRGLPNFVTMRVDDITGPLTWAHTAAGYGFRPFLAVFIGVISAADTADLRNLITNGLVTACVHSFDGGTEVYFDHAHLAPYSDSALSNQFYLASFWLTNNGILPSRILACHNSEVGPNAFAGLTNWGVEYFPLEVVPGQIEYYTNPSAPWLMAGPYRLYEPPGLGESTDPLYYADFLTVPGHPEFNGHFFNLYTEIRNVNPATQGWFEGGDWGPTTDVPSSILHGTMQLKRALDSLVLATVFSHQNYIGPLSDATWRAILQGVTNNLAPYNPIYVTLDYADQYVRATRTSRLITTSLNAYSGQLSASFSGATDLPTGVFVFTGQDASITNFFSPVPVFSNGLSTTVATFPVTAAPLPRPYLRAVPLTNGAMVLTWDASPNLVYTLQTALTLMGSTWTNLTSATVTAASSVAFTNPPDISTHRFFRVLVGIPP